MVCMTPSVRFLLLGMAVFILARPASTAAAVAGQRKEMHAQAEAEAKAEKERWATFDGLKKSHASLLSSARKVRTAQVNFSAVYGYVPRTMPGTNEVCATCPKVRAIAGWKTSVVDGVEKWNRDCDRKIGAVGKEKTKAEEEIKKLADAAGKLKPQPNQADASLVAAQEKERTGQQKKAVGLSSEKRLLEALRQWVNTGN